MSRSFTTKTAYLCEYIRMNGKVVLLACLSFLPALPMQPAEISSRNIFGWQPLMSTTFLRTFTFFGDTSVAQLYIYFPFFCLDLRNDLLAAHAHVINVCQEYRLPLFDDFLYSAVFTLRFTALAKRQSVIRDILIIGIRKVREEKEFCF